MCGMHRTTVSPSSSSTRRSTPCVAGCCGPMLMSMCSPWSPGSIDGGTSTATGAPCSSTTSGTRRGLPCASNPVVDSSTSTVRLVVAMLFSRPLARLEAALHVARQILERVGDGELFFRVAGLRVRRERLSQLLRATEPAAKRKILAQRIPFGILLPHEQAPQVRMAREADAEHVEALPLEPVGALVDVPDARHLEAGPALQKHLHAEEPAKRQRAEVPHDLDRLLEVAEFHSRHIREIVVQLRRVVVQPAHDLVQLAAVDDDRRLTPDDSRAREGAPESGPECLDRRAHRAAPVRNAF